MAKDKYGVSFSDDGKLLLKTPKDLQGEYVIPDGVVVIEEEAFKDQVGLTKIVIPHGVRIIRRYAFENTGLTSLSIPDDVVVVMSGAFLNCKQLQEVSVGANCVLLGGYDASHSIYVSDSPRGGVFQGCEKLSSIHISEGVLCIGQEAFRDCKALRAISIPKSVQRILRWAFQGCSNLANIELNEEGLARYDGMFLDYNGPLATMLIPNKVTELIDTNIEYCKSLLNFQVGKNHPTYTAIDGVVYSKDKKTLIRYPSGRKGEFVVPDFVEIINKKAFYGARGLSSVTFPNGLKEIYLEAFSGCDQLTSLTIPESVELIGMKAFGECWRLVDVQLLGHTTCYGFAFSGCKSLHRVICPQDYVESFNCSIESARQSGIDIFDECPDVEIISDTDEEKYTNAQ